MKAVLFLLVFPLVPLLSACSPVAVKSSVMLVASDLVGCYRSDDGTGYNVLLLRLKSDQTYKANIQGDIGSWGSASGRWKLEAESVTLQPIVEKERMQGFIGPLAVHHGPLQGYSLDPGTSIDKRISGWGWSMLRPVTCDAHYQDDALNPLL